MSTPSLEDLIELGSIQDAQGLRGQLKVRPHSSDPVALLSSKAVWLSLLPRGVAVAQVKTKPTLELYELKQAKMHSGTVVITLGGVTNRDQALALKGARILVARDTFPNAEADSYYWVDLIGCDAVNLEGIHLGQVLDVTENGAHGVIALGNLADGMTKQLVPFVKDVVQSVDLSKKCITLDWQADW
ncbi:ribosome maturation factor RimM [Polynucleobacter paludilacus]|uniref:ribosome maturation factor RimM n=1 Tax=Polynucleobacter paludilacus TaxID=1855895 RepID=UPI001BFEA0D4|nr:ribosome maturation factor RimM [Polynucleobacter paludilacus]QWD86601.1 ribosome maturation factor RimM [Polynucleobacter paludilacus]